MTRAILHLIRTLDPAAGGPVEFLNLICEAHTRMGARVAVVTLDDPAQKWEWPVSVFRCGPGAGSYGYQAGLTAKLRRIVKSFDLMILHGLWEYSSLAAARVARQRSLPYYVFTHGMLDPWFRRAFPLKHFKKQLYWLLFERGILQRARSVIFTSEGESRLAAKTFWPRSNYRKLIVPLGVRPAEGDREELRGRFLDRYPHLKGKRFLLFLGRLHPKKGCDLLLEAFSRLRPSLELVLAGPKSSTEYLEQLQKMAVGLPVTFTGMLTGPIKSGALVAADALILPSHQENFGMVVAEALSFGLPVLVSEQVNISDVVETFGAGLVEPDTLAGTCALIERWLAADQVSMRAAAERCYRERFEIERSARELLKLWSDGEGEERSEGVMERWSNGVLEDEDEKDSKMTGGYPLENRLARVAWAIVYVLLFRFSPRPLHGWRSWLLRLFGGRIGKRCHIYGKAKIWAPWNLDCRARACIADEAEIYNPAAVLLEEGAIISQGAFLCTASHDYANPDFPLVHAPIRIGRKAWVAARAIILPGITIGEGCIIGAGSVVTKSMPPHTVCGGNPARVIKELSYERTG